LNLELIKSEGSLLKMEMLRSEDWVLENIDYQVPDEEPANAAATLTPVSTFLMSLPVESIRVPLQPLFAELQEVRQLLHELGVDSVIVTLDLDLPEIGVRGLATVTGVDPCPAILSVPGKVVLTTFHHASSHLIDRYVSSQPPTAHASNSTGSTATFATLSTHSSAEALLFPTASRSEVIDQAWERIGVTGNHPIWSADRHDYVAAMELRVGERLKNLSGDVVWVQQKLARPGPAPVYNLEVQGELVYYVGANGVLAHNVGKGKKKCDDDNSEFYGNNRPSSVDNKWMARYDSKGHHSIPKFRGGHEKQVLHSLSNSDHDAFHSMLNHALKNGGFNGLDGYSSAESWGEYFSQNRGEQSRALGILRKVSAEFDRVSGTNLRQTIKHNIRRGKFKRYR